MTTLTTVYATDEDLAIRAAADFPILCPRDQKLAMGTDGAFGAADPWTLASDSANFLAAGLSPGQVVQLTGPATMFRPPGELLVIDSVGPGGITLRRKGQPPGVGQPPGAGSIVGVEFLIATLGPQIERASYDLNRRYGIDDLVAGRRASELYDPREVNEATVLMVLYRQYMSMSREAGASHDTFASKAAAAKAELDELLARVVVRWGPAGNVGAEDPPTTRFSTRLAR